MPAPEIRKTLNLVAVALGALGALAATSSVWAQDQKSPRRAGADAATSDGDGVSQYCANMGPAVSELRLARQIKRLNELAAEIEQRTRELDKLSAETREWVNKRQALLQAASEQTVAIFSKMTPEAAAARLALLEDQTAVSVLARLAPRTASAILNEMDSARAAKLTSLLSAAHGLGRKS